MTETSRATGAARIGETEPNRSSFPAHRWQINRSTSRHVGEGISDPNTGDRDDHDDGEGATKQKPPNADPVLCDGLTGVSRASAETDPRGSTPPPPRSSESGRNERGTTPNNNTVPYLHASRRQRRAANRDRRSTTIVPLAKESGRQQPRGTDETHEKPVFGSPQPTTRTRFGGGHRYRWQGCSSF